MKKNKDQNVTMFVRNDISYSDIKFSVNRAKGTVVYDQNPLKEICKDSRLPFNDTNEMLALVALYKKHLSDGGQREALIDGIIGPINRECERKNKFLH